MLSRHGHPVQIWTVEGYDVRQDAATMQFLQRHRGVTVHPVIPRIIMYDYGDTTKPPDLQVTPYDYDKNPTFYGKVEELVAGMGPALAGVGYVFAHDLLFQTSYLPHGIAIRQLAETHPKVKWIHWQHSGPPASPPDPLPPWPHRSRFAPMPQSRFLFINATEHDRALVAAVRGIPVRDLAFVPNPRDVMEYHDFDPLTQEFVRQHDLLSAEMLIVVPARLNEGKQPKKALMATQAFRQCGIDCRLVWVASFSPPDQKEHADYIETLKTFRDEIGLDPKAFLITSEFCKQWQLQTPRKSVRDLQMIADLLILPSLSEAHSLITMEAALCRQTLVLNADFPAMREWFAPGATYNWHFGSLRVQDLKYTDAEHPDESSLLAEMEYYQSMAWSVIHNLAKDRAWRAFSETKRFRNLDYVYLRYVAPLMASFEEK